MYISSLYFKQGLLLSAFLILSSDTSYGFPQLQMQQQIQQTQERVNQLQSQVNSLQQNLNNEQTNHQQSVTRLNQCEVDKGHFQQTLATEQNAHQQTELARQTLAADYQRQIQEGVVREQQLQEELRLARANAGGGGDPQQVAILQQEISRLRQQIAQGGGNVPPPPLETILVGIPVLNNAENFIHNIPPVVVDPQLDINKDNLIINIRGNDPNVIGGVLGDLLGRMNLPNGNPQKLNLNISKKRNIILDFENVRQALSNPNQIEWDIIKGLNTQLEEGQEGASGGGMMGALKRYSDLAKHGGQTFIDLKTNVEQLLNLQRDIEHAANGNVARQEQEDLRTLIQQADQEIQINAAPPHAQLLNVLSDKVNEIEGLLPQLDAIINQIDQNISDYENAMPDPVDVSPRSYGAKTSLLEIMNLIKTYNIPELSKALFKGVQKGISPAIANHLLILDDIRIGLLMSNSPILNFRGKIPVARTAFEDLIDRVAEFNNLYNPLDNKRKDIFIIRDNSTRFNQLRQQIAGAIPKLPDQAMNLLLNRIIHLDPLAIADGQERNEYARDIRTLKNFVTDILNSEDSPLALIHTVSPVYSLCHLFENVAEASSQMANRHNKAP